ncbi:MAG: hypothetical protein N2593_03135 [Patescibacteria group bacterium]|nr:hypothetical protein [Patescibacteria group bacterium]
MKKLFTLIEIIIVLGVLGFFLPIIFSIIFTISRESIKIDRISLIKRQGDYIINELSLLIKNYALNIYSSEPPIDTFLICKNSDDFFISSEKMIFEDKEKNWFKIYLNGDKISSYSSFLDKNIHLNTNDTKIYNFFISCENKSFYSSPIVNIRFNICYKGNSNDCILNSQEEISDFLYQTKIKLRNY